MTHDAPAARACDPGCDVLVRPCTDHQVSGSPTVLLEAGGGAFAIDWSLGQPPVAVHVIDGIGRAVSAVRARTALNSR